MLLMELSRTIRTCAGNKKLPVKQVSAITWILSGALVFGLSGCGPKAPQQTQAEAREQSPVVARVNGESITQADVDFMLERMLKGQALVQADEALRKKILDSLISSKAMKIQTESLLSAQEKESIARSVKAYEEELYVKEYLSNHVVPEPVTLEMIQAYYDKHPDEFGGESVRDFQMLVLNTAQDQQSRDKFLAAIPQIKAAKDWASARKQWEQAYAVQYQEGRARPGLLDPALEQVISKLAATEVSDLVYADDQIYLVKIINVTQVAPKPLAAVSADIRKQLAAQQLRAAVKKASDEVLKTVQVTLPGKASGTTPNATQGNAAQ